MIFIFHEKTRETKNIVEDEIFGEFMSAIGFFEADDPAAAAGIMRSHSLNSKYQCKRLTPPMALGLHTYIQQKINRLNQLEALLRSML